MEEIELRPNALGKLACTNKSLTTLGRVEVLVKHWYLMIGGLVCIAALVLIGAYEEQFYNDYFMRLPGSSETINAADFQAKIVAFYNWKDGEARPLAPVAEALGICEVPIEVLMPVLNDCPGLVMMSFKFCSEHDSKRYGALREVNKEIFDQLSPMQKDIVRYGWFYERF